MRNRRCSQPGPAFARRRRFRGVTSRDHHSRGVSRSARAHLAFEPLEDRTLLSATVANGLLSVVGSDQGDAMHLTAGPNLGDVALFGVPGVPDGTVFSGVAAVDVDALAGDDFITIDPLGLLEDPQLPTPCYDVAGGPGSDTIEIAALVGAPGYGRDYRIDAGEGNNTTRLLLGDGTGGESPPEGTTVEVAYQSGDGADVLEVQYTGPVEVEFRLTAMTAGGEDAVSSFRRPGRGASRSSRCCPPRSKTRPSRPPFRRPTPPTPSFFPPVPGQMRSNSMRGSIPPTRASWPPTSTSTRAKAMTW